MAAQCRQDGRLSRTSFFFLPHARGPIHTRRRLRCHYTHRTRDAAAPYRLDPIQCCSTLTGLGETYTFICACSPPGLVSGTRGNACEQEPDKSASRNIHTSCQGQAKQTSVHRDEWPAFCAQRWWNQATRRRHGRTIGENADRLLFMA